MPQADLTTVGTFVVNTADDVADLEGCDGTHCSLREAIQAANATPDADRIEFAIPGTGPHVIQPGSELPAITQPVEIDGYSQAGSSENTDAAGTNAVIRVVLDGGGMGIATGLNLVQGDANGSDGSIIEGLAIGGFTEGIRVEVNEVVIRGNFIGTDAGGSALPNRSGVTVGSGDNVQIGGTSAGDRNLISGNEEDGILLFGSTTVQGNLIGLNAGGDAALPNGGDGIEMQSFDALIGGDLEGARNVISGNGLHGIYLLSTFTSSRTNIEGNYIGIDASGLAAVPNGSSGVLLERVSDTIIRANVISGHVPGDDPNGGAGIRLIASSAFTSDRNIITGNRIGTDAAGTAALPNGIGVWLSGTMNELGSEDATDRNIISGNSDVGVVVVGGENAIRGNYIGTDASGEAALSNATGIRMQAGNSIIGGFENGEGNVISGNTGAGIEIFDQVGGSAIQGNLVGLAADGTTALPNQDGIVVQPDASGVLIGGDPLFTGPAVGNVISANTGFGILVRGENNLIRSNLIGVAADGTTARGNGDAGIRIEKTGSDDGQSVIGNEIGGYLSSLEFITRTANVIAYNGGPGVAIVGLDFDAPTSNPIRANAIFDNGGLGIDLSNSESGYDGSTDNDTDDTDSGPNLLQNFPELDEAVTDRSNTVVKGIVPGDIIGAFTIELFSVPACDTSGHGEGAVFLGHGFSDDNSGDTFQAFEITVGGTTPGHHITATATDPFGNTSEFSACIEILNLNLPPTIDMGGPYDGFEGSAIPLDIAVTDADGNPSGLNFSFDAGNGESGSLSSEPEDHVYADDGSFTYAFTADDQDNPPVTAMVQIEVANVAPDVTIQSLPGTAGEGQSVDIEFTFADPGLLDDPWTYSVDWGDGSTPTTGQTDTRNGSLGASHTYAVAGSYTVTVKVVDKDGGEGTATQGIEVTADNVAPTLGVITAPVDPQPVNETVAISAGYTDPDTGDTHTVTIEWGDGTAPDMFGVSGGNAAGTHTFVDAGVYRIRMTVQDDEGAVSNEQVFEYVVVYDPSAGFVTGGGLIDSPAGAYTPDPALGGKASFGFVARYRKGANTPTGNTEFRFQTAGFTFRSTSYQWLVVAGARAQYKGEGEVNDVGGYGFILTATDGEVRGGGGADRFRIKIVDPAGGVIYDNVRGGSDRLGETDPQAITRGSIVIHGR